MNARAAASSWRSSVSAVKAWRGKSRITHDHAVESEMNPFFTHRPDHVILEMVERERPPSDRERPQIKERKLAQAAEVLRHAGFQHTMHGERIIGVDIIGQAGLRAREPLRRRLRVDGGDERHDPIEIGTICLKPGEVDAAAIIDVASEHVRPEHLPFAIAHCGRRLLRGRHRRRRRQQGDQTHC